MALNWKRVSFDCVKTLDYPRISLQPSSEQLHSEIYIGDIYNGVVQLNGSECSFLTGYPSIKNASFHPLQYRDQVYCLVTPEENLSICEIWRFDRDLWNKISEVPINIRTSRYFTLEENLYILGREGQKMLEVNLESFQYSLIEGYPSDFNSFSQYLHSFTYDGSQFVILDPVIYHFDPIRKHFSIYASIPESSVTASFIRHANLYCVLSTGATLKFDLKTRKWEKLLSLYPDVTNNLLSFVLDDIAYVGTQDILYQFIP